MSLKSKKQKSTQHSFNDTYKKVSLSIKNISKDTVELLQKDDRLFQLFVKKNAGFIHNIVGKFSPPDQMDYDDYFQIGLISLYKALHKFDADRGVSLSTFAYTCIYNDILQYVNKSHKIVSKEISIEKFLRKYDNGLSGEYNESVFEDHHFSVSNFEDSMVNDIVMKDYISTFEDIHKQIFDLRFVKKMKHKDIAKLLGLNIHTYKHIFYFSVYPMVKQLSKMIST